MVRKVVGFPGFMCTRPKCTFAPGNPSTRVCSRISRSPILTPPEVSTISHERKASRKASLNFAFESSRTIPKSIGAVHTVFHVASMDNNTGRFVSGILPILVVVVVVLYCSAASSALISSFPVEKTPTRIRFLIVMCATRHWRNNPMATGSSTCPWGKTIAPAAISQPLDRIQCCGCKTAVALIRSICVEVVEECSSSSGGTSSCTSHSSIGTTQLQDAGKTAPVVT